MDSRPIHIVLEPFGEAVMSEATDAFVAPWCDKSGFSMFDEEEVLGVPVLKPPTGPVHPSLASANTLSLDPAADVGAAQEALPEVPRGTEAHDISEMSGLFESNAV